MNIRFVTPEDSKALLSIYAQYIDTPITCEYRLPSEEIFKQRICTIMDDYPYLVCENDMKQIVGYAYAHRHMERAAYQWNVELSIYFDRQATSKGYGYKTYDLLLNIIKAQGIRNAYAGVTIPNEKSEKLHYSLDFRLVGVYHNTAFKNDRWFDVAWFEKSIIPHDTPSIPVRYIRNFSANELQQMIAIAR